jgi:anti-sigma B factor antagonist
MAGETGFSIQFETPARGLAVVEVADELDSFTAPALLACVAQILDDGPSRLIVDCSRLESVDPSALGDLVGVARRAAGQAVDFVFVCLPGEVARIFSIADLVHALTMYRTRQEALDAA